MGYFPAPRFCVPVSCATFSPNDATTYYYGVFPGVPSTNQNFRCIWITSPCTVRKTHIYWTGGVPSNEDVSLYIRHNDTTDYLIATVGSTDATKAFINLDMNIPCVAGDKLEIKMVCPTWVTNPINVHNVGIIEFSY